MLRAASGAASLFSFSRAAHVLLVGACKQEWHQNPQTARVALKPPTRRTSVVGHPSSDPTSVLTKHSVVASTTCPSVDTWKRWWPLVRAWPSARSKLSKRQATNPAINGCGRATERKACHWEMYE